MGRKKKVDINGAPLQSVTIGEIKESKFGWLGTILLFGIFGGIIFYLPELTEIYQQYLGKNTTVAPSVSGNTINNTVNNTVAPSEEEEDNSLNLNSFATDKELVWNSLTFSEIALVNNQLTFNVKNTGQSSIDLQKSNLYFVTYDKNTDDALILNNIALNGIVASSGELSYSFQIKSGAAYYEVKDISEDEYTYIDLTPDENNNIFLTCKKDGEEISYTFLNDKLRSLSQTATVSKSAENYDELYSAYNTLVVRYGLSNGVKAGLSTNMVNMTFSFNVDYTTFTGNINEIKYFAKDTSPRVVNFKMESLLYECS